MLPDLIEGHPPDLLFQFNQNDLFAQVNQPVQYHRSDDQYNRHDVYFRNKSCCRRSRDTRCGMDWRRRQRFRDPRMTPPTGLLQIHRMNRRGRVGVCQNPVRTVTGGAVGYRDVPRFAFESMITVDPGLQATGRDAVLLIQRG